MPAGIYNFNCEQGSTFERVIEVTNNDDTIKNLDGVTGRMQVRTTIDAASAMVEFTTANGKMFINGELGTVTLSLTAAETAALTQSGVYDLELIDASGEVDRLIEGNFNLEQNVTV